MSDVLNFNDPIWVQLTDHGRAVAGKSMPFEHDGWSRWYLCDLASVLGPHIHMVGPVMNFRVHLKAPKGWPSYSTIGVIACWEDPQSPTLEVDESDVDWGIVADHVTVSATAESARAEWERKSER